MLTKKENEMQTNARSKSTYKENSNAKDKAKPVSEMAEKAMRNYEQALRTGVKLQEEAGRWWTTMLNQTASAQDWQKRVTNFTTVANGIMPIAQRRMEEVMDLMEKNSRTGADLLKKAVDAAQSPAIADSQAKWMEVWTSSLGAVRSNAEALTQINTRMIDSWIDFARKNTEVTEVRMPKTS
jgi:hypothetical protein